MLSVEVSGIMTVGRNAQGGSRALGQQKGLQEEGGCGA